jgi:hypothetical protein
MHLSTARPRRRSPLVRFLAGKLTNKRCLRGVDQRPRRASVLLRQSVRLVGIQRKEPILDNFVSGRGFTDTLPTSDDINVDVVSPRSQGAAIGRARQLAIARRQTAGSSLKGAMVSRVM